MFNLTNSFIPLLEISYFLTWFEPETLRVGTSYLTAYQNVHLPCAKQLFLAVMDQRLVLPVSVNCQMFPTDKQELTVCVSAIFILTTLCTFAHVHVYGPKTL